MSAAAKNFSPKNVQRGRKNRRQRTDASPLPRILPERPPRNGKKFCTQSAADGKFRKDLERRAACPGAETGRWMPYKPWSAARLPPPPAGADKTGRNILRGSIRKQSRKILTARRHLRRYRALHSKKECWGGTATKAPVGLSTGQTGLRSAQMPPVVFGRQG